MYKSQLKKSILKEIYFDNLKVAGKLIEQDDLPITTPAAYKKFLQALIIVFPLVLTSFSTIDTPAIPIDETLAQVNQQQPVSPETLEFTFLKMTDMTDPVEFWTSPSNHFSSQPPSSSVSWSNHESLKDYSLLLSRNDHVRLSSLFGLGIKTIVVDPGHGGKDSGARGIKGTREKHITLDVAFKLKQRLDSYGRFNVLLTRDKDELLTLAERVDFAKENKADLFISIHVNSQPNQTINLIETYYFGPPLNSETIWLAEQENKESYFSVNELIGIIQDIGNTLKRQESAMLAAAIQSSLYQHLSVQDPDVINSGVKMAPFVVLSQIEVPSVLVEISCITNEEEEAKLRTAKYREKIASYIDEGIVAYLDTNYFKTVNGENYNERE